MKWCPFIFFWWSLAFHMFRVSKCIWMIKWSKFSLMVLWNKHHMFFCHFPVGYHNYDGYLLFFYFGKKKEWFTYFMFSLLPIGMVMVMCQNSASSAINNMSGVLLLTQVHHGQWYKFTSKETQGRKESWWQSNIIWKVV